jgi:alkylation response protein AidB-like acyl-CoA dehydrogenase
MELVRRNGIGVPPVLSHGTEQKRRFLPCVCSGRIRFCLGITEPGGTCGSKYNETYE